MVAPHGVAVPLAGCPERSERGALLVDPDGHLMRCGVLRHSLVHEQLAAGDDGGPHHRQLFPAAHAAAGFDHPWPVGRSWLVPQFGRVSLGPGLEACVEDGFEGCAQLGGLFGSEALLEPGLDRVPQW